MFLVFLGDIRNYLNATGFKNFIFFDDIVINHFKLFFIFL